MVQGGIKNIFKLLGEELFCVWEANYLYTVIIGVAVCMSNKSVALFARSQQEYPYPCGTVAESQQIHSCSCGTVHVYYLLAFCFAFYFAFRFAF